ncbi:hypothetical protein F5890DRAFT_1552317 [Lentinula detonsa]|uniref:HMG box domain-containing protein n=1 Tax=Lentinula detonsa TaxID=2804962 RepID=A0AA38UTU9_9AGAR|nr:hypothetical protein F5890DRAFT_1552317 [Lentinula detonsa]
MPAFRYAPEVREIKFLASSTTSCKSRRAKKKAEGYIPRPPNAFILFRQNFVRNVYKAGTLEYNDLTLGEVISNQWALTDQSFWYEKAKIEKERHQALYPNYQFRPKHKKRQALSNSTSTDDASSTTASSRCDHPQTVIKMVRQGGVKRQKHPSDISIRPSSRPYARPPWYSSIRYSDRSDWESAQGSFAGSCVQQKVIPGASNSWQKDHPSNLAPISSLGAPVQDSPRGGCNPSFSLPPRFNGVDSNLPPNQDLDCPLENNLDTGSESSFNDLLYAFYRDHDLQQPFDSPYLLGSLDSRQCSATNFDVSDGPGHSSLANVDSEVSSQSFVSAIEGCSTHTPQSRAHRQRNDQSWQSLLDIGRDSSFPTPSSSVFGQWSPS